MNAKNVGLGLLALVAATLAGYLALSGDRRAAESMDRSVFFVCQAESCREEFQLTMRQYASARRDGSPPCPACGQHLARQASKCDACGGFVEHVLHASLPPECPHCGHAFVADVEGVRETQAVHERQHAPGGG